MKRKKNILKLSLGKKNLGLDVGRIGIGKLSLLGIGSLGCVGIVLLAMLMPVVPSDTSALMNASDTAISRINVHNAAMVSIALNSNIDIDVTPTADGSFTIGNTRLSVTTNNPEGYKIFLNTVASNSLNGAKANIESITAPTVGLSFTGNTWGYNLLPGINEATVASNFQTIPISATLAYNAPTATVEEATHQYNLAFGVHVTPSLPAGSYSNSLVVSVVANPIEISSLADLVYMQDMNSEICSNTPSAYNETTGKSDTSSPYYLEPVTKQLYDIRDGNMYWVAKLADGNCWMVQNLALDLNENTVLTAADSDLGYVTEVKGNAGDGSRNSKGGWVTVNNEATEKYGVGTKNGLYTWGNDSPFPVTTTNQIAFDGNPGDMIQTNTFSWDLGKIVLATPIAANSCNDRNSSINVETSAIYTDKLAEICSGSGFVDVSNSEWSPTFSTQEGTIILKPNTYPDYATVEYKDKPDETYTGLVAINQNIKQYDSHYLIGNYYQYNTATAGTGGTSVNTNAQGSICPKGWKLPTSGTDSYNTNGSFSYLLKQYNFLDEASDSGDVFITMNGTSYDIAENPRYFVRSGYIALSSGFLRIAGADGYGWPATNTSKIWSGDGFGAYYLDFGATKFGAAVGPINRYLGFPVRCLAR